LDLEEAFSIAEEGLVVALLNDFNVWNCLGAFVEDGSTDGLSIDLRDTNATQQCHDEFSDHVFIVLECDKYSQKLNYCTNNNKFCQLFEIQNSTKKETETLLSVS